MLLVGGVGGRCMISTTRGVGGRCMISTTRGVEVLYRRNSVEY